MKRSCVSIILMIILIPLVGCSSVSVQSHPYLGAPALPPTDPGHVAIFREAPTRPYARLGEINIEPTGNPKPEQISDKLKDTASNMGADGVIIVSDTIRVTGSYLEGPWWAPEVIYRYGRIIVGVAIKFKTNSTPSGAG